MKPYPITRHAMHSVHIEMLLSLTQWMSQAEIARRTGASLNTIRRMLSADGHLVNLPCHAALSVFLLTLCVADEDLFAQLKHLRDRFAFVFWILTQIDAVLTQSVYASGRRPEIANGHRA